jgi:uncharacterized protein (DUF427 family)
MVPESVWDYPRPPRLEPEVRPVTVELGGTTVCATQRAWRVLETSHPPVYYLPATDFSRGALRPASGTTFCEWKGWASYLDVVAGSAVAARAAWTYPTPSSGYEQLAGHVAVYCAAMDRCTVGDEVATPQPGGFYGGWVTSWVTGPFKGEPGTSHW